MRPALRFAFPAYLVLEVFLTLAIASWLGSAPTLLLLVLGAAAGFAVLRRAQFSLLSRLRRSFASGEPLLPGLLDGALRSLAGVLLIVPGFISDVAAAALLVPQLRRRLTRGLSAGHGNEPAGPTVIEADYRRIEGPALPPPREPGRC